MGGGTTPINWAQQAVDVGKQALGGVMGMIFGKRNDRRQLEQQKKLSEMQLGFNKQMTDYQHQKQLEMWHATSYGAQKGEMEAAGLNPAMMYGMGGGGGATTGGGAAISGGAASAPQGGREIQDAMGMGLNISMMRAQQELIAAQTEKTKAEAQKISGVDTQLGETQIESLSVGIENTKAQTRATELQGDIAELDKELKDATLENAISKIAVEMQIANRTFENMTRQGWIDENTKHEKIQLVRKELLKIGLENALTEQLTKESGSRQNVNAAEVSKKAADIAQGWEALKIQNINAVTQQQRLELDKWIHDVSDQTKLTVETIGKTLQSIGIGGLLSKLGAK